MSTAAVRPQSFANHRALPPIPLMIALAVITGEFMHRVWLAEQSLQLADFWAALVWAAVLVGAASARNRAMVVQDRVIRLEMHLRLERLLGAARRADVARLTKAQLVALRFASDAELPQLVDEVLAGKLVAPTAIKKRVKDWQPDWLRV